MTYLDRVTHFATLRALDFRPVLGLRAVAREVTLFLTIAARHVVRIERLIAFLRDVVL